MAVGTAGSDIPECPFFLFPVTVKAGNGQVRAFQGEGPPVMLIHRVTEAGKALQTVTIGAVGCYPVLYELTVMIIAVTVGTAFVLQGIREFRFVTGFAGHDEVLFFKLISSFVMIEILHILHQVEGFFAVTLPAVLSELVLMRVFVAAGTVGVLKPAELLELLPVGNRHLMTFDAVDCLMLSCKLEFCIVVTEFRCGPEEIGNVAVQAGIRKGL